MNARAVMDVLLNQARYQARHQARRNQARRRAHAAYRSATTEPGLLPVCGSSVRPLASQRLLADRVRG